jgi:hypothetical protein
MEKTIETHLDKQHAPSQVTRTEQQQDLNNLCLTNLKKQVQSIHMFNGPTSKQQQQQQYQRQQ